jgi:oligopeptide transport system permease protein
MIGFIIRRLLQAIPVLFIVVTMTFFMVKAAPGGPFDREKKTAPEIKKRLEAHYGLDKPLLEQYWIFLGDLTHGSLQSYRYPNWTVQELIANSFPVSLELGFWALLVAMFLGLSAGLIASLRPNSARDYWPMGLAMVGICLPSFVLGPLLSAIFGIKLDWFNASGWYFPEDRVLPAVTLGIYYAAYIARLTRGGMLEILNQDYIRTARAKGASESRVVLSHALKGGLLPVVSFLGPAVAGLLTGSFVVETIFQIPGLGKFFVTSAFNRDYFMVAGSVVFYAALLVVLNLIVDVVLVWLNPKLRFE